WQYAGAIRNKTLAWTVAAIICAIVWYLYVSFTDPVKEKLPNQFWLLVALPLLLIYSLRVIFPDISFDVLDYHIFQGERVLRGPASHLPQTRRINFAYDSDRFPAGRCDRVQVSESRLSDSNPDGLRL